MQTLHEPLPHTRDEWIAMIAQRDHLLQEKEQRIDALTERLAFFEEQFRLLQAKQFGSSSEQSPLQSQLFNEAELIADATPEVPEQTITTTRAKPGRKALPAHIPTQRIEYTLPAEEQICACCGGALHAMSTETREELQFIPAQLTRIEHVRHVYGCRQCERSGESVPIVTAPAPKPPIAKSYASASLLAYIIVAKFVDGLPLYRLEAHFERLGIGLSRQVMSIWMIRAAQVLAPVVDRLTEALRRRTILHADETTLQVLQEPGRAAQSQSYLWLYRSSGEDGPPIVLYDYQQTRAGEHPRAFLTGFRGYLHVDGYAGYQGIENVTLVGCWAHARREFHEAVQALPPDKRQTVGKAHEGLGYCNRLYAIERELKDGTPEHRREQRHARSLPLVEQFYAWLGGLQSQVLPQTKLGKAVGYCLNQREKLERFLDDGRLDIDNNRAERSIKPFVIGRKNWLFANTPSGARASALLYSLVETAKENGLNPADYLMRLLQVLPNTEITDDAIDALLPWNVRAQNSAAN
jgi:transposase